MGRRTTHGASAVPSASAALAALVMSIAPDALGGTTLERQRSEASHVDSVGDARTFLAAHPGGPVARAVRERRYALRVRRSVVEDGEPIRSVRFEYDAAGNRVRRVWHDGDWSEMQHDALGHLLRERFYESDGTRFGRIVYDYDEHGRRIRERYITDPRSAPALDTRYMYDRAGNVAREITVRADRSRTIEIHARDAAGQLRFTRSRTHGADGTVTATGRVTYARDTKGHRTHRFELGNGPEGRFLARTRDVRDDDGRLLHREDERTAGGRMISQERTYDYDDAGRLVAEHVETGGGREYRVEYSYEKRPIDFSGYLDALR